VPSFLPDLSPGSPNTPSRHLALLSRRISLTWVGMALASLALIVIWATTWQRTGAERQLLESNALAQQRSVAVILSENLTQVVDRGRLQALSADGWFAGQRTDTATRIANQLTTDQVFLRAALYDTALKLQFQTSPSPDGIQDLTPLQQAVARLHVAEGRSVAAVIVPPDGGAQKWSLPLLYAVPGGQGETEGYLLLYLDLGYLLQLYRDVELGDTGSIRLLAHDNTVLAEARAAGLSERTRIERFDGLGGTDTRDGHRVLASSDNGEAQFHAFRRAERTPFKVVVSRNVSELMAGHERFSLRVWTTLALLSAVLLLAASLLLRGLRRQQALIQALSRSDQEKHELIVQLEDEKTRALALASQDHLTGLNNRRMFNQLAGSHLAAARRSRKHYALLYLDLDRFKPINDSLGHHVGDLLLQEVAARLHGQVRSGDILGRLGGDEFALLVTGVDETADVGVIATKLVTALSQPYPDLDGHELHITPSIGVALFPRDGHDLASLSRNADTAMYQSKRAGRGRYSYYDATLNPSGSRRYALERQLPRAIQDGELVLHFQPKVQLSDMRLVGLEALVRWQHPEFGLVHPGEFIGLAEQSGLIGALGDWVMSACCAQQARWRADGLPLVPLAFNVSPQQLRDPSLPVRLDALLRQHDIAASDVEIEITESSLVEPVDVAAKALREIERMGVGIALDDFGSGFSSLGQIRQLPIHKLKIDRSFINDLRSNADVGVIVTSIITLAHNLDMRVVAEGVELMDQLVYLKTAGCDEVQGYFLGRPQPVDDTARLLLQRHIHPQ
jgi:diguanylate cyclase (GGDEF)-like protein